MRLRTKLSWYQKRQVWPLRLGDIGCQDTRDERLLFV